ncbi:hypothetical protein ASD15_05135 [Massilia sp. Root351]|nr:hypothetical protein ASD15_05135 [Massilia sp. Root351]
MPPAWLKKPAALPATEDTVCAAARCKSPCVVHCSCLPANSTVEAGVAQLMLAGASISTSGVPNFSTGLANSTVEAGVAQLMLAGASISTSGVPNFSTGLALSASRDPACALTACWPLTAPACLPLCWGSTWVMKSLCAAAASLLVSACCAVAASPSCLASSSAAFSCARDSALSIWVEAMPLPCALRALVVSSTPSAPRTTAQASVRSSKPAPR